MRIGIIVDNPSRDLEGLVLLANHLVEHEHETFLIPMYSQGLEVPALGLDVVVLNYARNTNTRLIKSYHDAGIAVTILDTEGGVWESEEQFVRSVNHQEVFDKITKYFLWGEKQKAAFLRETNFTETQLSLTGCPRYDFYHESLIDAVKDPILESPKHILVISNFALSNPKFGSPDQEVEALVRVGYNKDYAIERLKDDQKNRKALKETVARLSSDFPSKKIIVRAHPFESDEDYLVDFSNLNNVEVNSSGVVSSWLKNAAACIHCNSSVAIDAYMMKRPMFTLAWANSEITQNMAEMSYNLSFPAQSYEELQEQIKNCFQQENYWDKIKPSNQAVDNLNSWFHPCDGKSANRVASALNSIKGSVRPITKTSFKRIARNASKGQSSIVGKIDYLGSSLVGGKLYNFLRQKYLNPNAAISSRLNKKFSCKDINEVLSRIQKAKISLVNTYATEPKKADYVLARIGSEAIKITLKK